MKRAVENFSFQDAPNQSENWAALARIPQGIKSKGELMEALCTTLQFPDYFGNNWDAAEECLRDLSWFPSGSVVLIHEDLPLQNDLVNLGIYLTILDDAVEHWKKKTDRQLIVVFPENTKNTVVREFHRAE